MNTTVIEYVGGPFDGTKTDKSYDCWFRHHILGGLYKIILPDDEYPCVYELFGRWALAMTREESIEFVSEQWR